MRGRLARQRDQWLPPGSVRYRIASGASWALGGTVVSNAFGLVTGMITARVLGREGYGQLGLLVSTYAVFSQFGWLGLGDTVTKHVAQFRASDPDQAGRIAGGATTTAWLSFAAMAAVLAVFARPIAGVFLNAPALSGPLRMSSLYLLAAGVNGIQLGILSGFEDFKGIARINAVRAFVNLPVTAAAAFWFGLNGVVLTLVLVTVGTALLSAVEVRRAAAMWGVRFRYALDSSHASLFWHFSLPAFMAGNLVVPASWAVNAMLVHQPNGFGEMGLLNAANQWRALAVLIPTVASSVTLPIHSNLYGEADHDRYHRSVLANLALQGGLSVIVVAAMLLLGPIVLGAYGPGFTAGTPAFLWLALSWLFLAPTWILWGVMVSSNRVWTGFLFNFVGAAALLCFAWAWSGRGAQGIAMAYFVAGALQFVLQGGHFAYWRKTQRS